MYRQAMAQKSKREKLMNECFYTGDTLTVLRGYSKLSARESLLVVL